MNKALIQRVSFISLLLMIISLVSCQSIKNGKKNVLTLGTIHNYHANSAYSYNDILNVLTTYKPDLICVEIKPEIFRRDNYLSEMMIAIAYGDINKIPVVPVDWYDETNNDRIIRDSLSRTDKYVKLMRINDSLQQNSEILKAFTKKYGENVYKNNSLDIDFWNGADYSNSVRESYRISVGTFGDSPFNLHYITRNRKMLQYIRDGIRKSNAKKVIILTGAEHKSFFDDSLKKDFDILSLENINPLAEANFDEFLRKMRPETYFISADSSSADEYYGGLNLPYFHGMRMDLDISNINLKNLPEVEIILENWEAAAPNSARLLYDRAWYYFLNKEYDNAIKYANRYLGTNKFATTPFKDWGALRIIALCYDLKKQRNDAINYYNKARQSMSRTMPSNVVDLFLSNYEKKPYERNNSGSALRN